MSALNQMAPTTVTDPKTLVSPKLFKRLASRLALSDGSSIAIAEAEMTQALAFLKACADNPGKLLVPPFEVDNAWHMFILHTKEYAAFCDRIAGRFLHHEPVDAREDGGAAIQATAQLIRAAGLLVDYDMWRPARGCLG